MKRFTAKITVVLLISIGVVNSLFGQDSTKSKWHYLGELYMMAPNMKGDIAVGNLPAVEMDAASGDILGHLKMGAMFYVEASNDDWSISSDFIYMKLGQGVAIGKIISSGDVTMKQKAWEIAGLKRVAKWLDVGLGGRYVYLYTALDLETINGAKSGSASRDWVDPIIILRSNNIIKDNWLAQLRLDAGGFRVGSDFTWQLQANVGYRFSELFQTTFGYRYIGIDYDEGENDERFLYDVDTYGWVVRLGFNF